MREFHIIIEVFRRIDEAFVYGVDVYVVPAEIVEIDRIDVRAVFDVELHLGEGGDIFDILRNLKYPAAIFHTKRLHGGRNRKTDCLFGAACIGYDKVCRQRVQPTFHAFHRGEEGFQVDGKIDSVLFREKYGINADYSQDARFLLEEELAKTLRNISEEEYLSKVPESVFRYTQFLNNKLFYRDELLNRICVPENEIMNIAKIIKIIW